MTLKTYNDIDSLQFELSEECINDCSHQGECYDDVANWVLKLDLQVDREAAIQWLMETGAWTPEEMAEETDETLAQRILWIAAGSAKEDRAE